MKKKSRPPVVPPTSPAPKSFAWADKPLPAEDLEKAAISLAKENKEIHLARRLVIAEMELHNLHRTTREQTTALAAANARAERANSDSVKESARAGSYQGEIADLKAKVANLEREAKYR